MGLRRSSALAASWGLFAMGAFALVGNLMLFRLAPPSRPPGAAFRTPLLLVGSGIDLRKQYRALRGKRWRTETAFALLRRAYRGRCHSSTGPPKLTAR